MRRRILSLLLALCLIVSLLPMAVLAEDPAEPEVRTSTLAVSTGTNDAGIQWKPKLSEGMAPAYAKTTAAGSLVTEGATESDYNLKVEWPTGGKPTLTMNNATLSNDHHYVAASGDVAAIAVVHTISIGGTADFVILLKGTNVINGNHLQASTTTAAYQMTKGIIADNDGSLTISSFNKNTDKLLIDNYGGICISTYNNDVIIENANVTLQMHNTGSNAQFGLVVSYGKTGREDMANLKVLGSIFTIEGGKHHSNNLIVMGGKDDKYSSTNTGDILFQNSKIRVYRSNSTGSSTSGTEPIRYGSGSTFIIDRCDTLIYGRHRTVNYAPAIINCASATTKGDGSSYPEVDYAYNAGDAISGKAVNTIKTTHTCLAGEPVVNKPEGECASKEESITYCVVCNEELSKTVTPLPTPSKGHNPGQKVLLKQTNATLAVKNGAAYTAGTYQWQYTCTVCGETWEETESFNPGILYYIKPAADYHNADDKAANPKYQYGPNWNTNYYSPQHIIQPGTTLYFLTQVGANEHIPTNAYLVQTTDAEVIANGTWNVKVEYPVGGTPVMTLNNATIINGAGIWWGFAVHENTAPLTIIVKGENTIAQTRYTNGGILNFRTKADVTITGSGTLNLVSNGNGAAIRSSKGNIIFDNANINLQNFSASSAAHGVQAETGSITINGGNFNMYGKRNNASEVYSAIRTAGDITIKGGANVSITQACSTNDYGLLHADKNITISESTVRLASVYRGHAIRYGGEFTVEYAHGFTAHSVQELTTLLDDETYSYPVDFATDTTYDKLVTRISRYYLDIAPDKALVNFTGTAVTIKDDLDISFKLDAAKVDTNGTVKFTVNGEEITKALSEVGVTEGDNYVITLPGLSAKQMRDEITVTVCDAEGKALTETKSDSVLAYALRLLRCDKYATNDELTSAMKTFVVDMLIYGAMAQIQFGTESALVTAALNGVEWGYATTEASSTTKTPATVTGNGYVGTTFELKSNIGMAIALDAAVLADVASAKVTFTDYLGNAKEFTAEKDATSNEQFTVFVFNELAAANGRQDITWTFYNAESEVVLTVVDSLANYVSRARADYPYTDELLKYCDSAKAYFTLANAN